MKRKEQHLSDIHRYPTKLSLSYKLNEAWQFIFGLIILALSSSIIASFAISFLLTKLDSWLGSHGAPLTVNIAKSFNARVQKLFERTVLQKEDYYFISWLIFLGLCIPSLFILCALHTKSFGFSLILCAIYNGFRLGPNQLFASWAYAFGHKESHMYGQIFVNPYNYVLGRIFNWYVTPFYGMIPQSIYYGHVLNHHKYDNRQDDLISSSDRPRNSLLNFIKFVPRFSGYSYNVTTIVQFYKEKQYQACVEIALGITYWLAIVAFLAYTVSPAFAWGYFIHPSLEQNFIFAGFAWGWHAFIDPEDPENEYINSVTIVDGEFNDLNEGYHVVHHQYPSAHWSQNKTLYEKHKDEYYKGNHATMFKNIESFQLFILIVTEQYETLAKKYATRHDLNLNEKINLIRTRLETCTWGPHTNTLQKRFKWE